MGVNKVSLVGIVQPLLDAVKLLLKKIVFPERRIGFLFLIRPLRLFIFSLGLWGVFSFYSRTSVLLRIFFTLFFLRIMSLSLFCIRWFSGSKYPSLGILRSCVLGVSLEACFGVLLFGVSFWFSTFRFNEKFLFLKIWFFLFWLFLILVDSITRPFDLVEAESELVSGFNTEFGSVLFIFIFLREYIVKVFFSFLTSLVFMGGSWLVLFLTLLFFISCQTTFLRIKSEWVIGFLWLKFLPVLLFFIILWFFW